MSILHHLDCLSGLHNVENESINLTVTSPPYNLTTAKKNPVHYHTYTDDKNYNTYLAWLTDVFAIIFEKTTPDGRLAINIGDQKNGAIPTHTFLQMNLMEIGWKPFSTIIWYKKQTRNRSAWGSYLSPSSPSFPSPYEYILILYKESKKLQHKGETDLTKEEFVKSAYGVWEITPETKRAKWRHPAPFPSEIPRRLIKMLTYKGDTVLDPFAGVGTTLITADALERESIGFEIDQQYCSVFEQFKSMVGSSH